MSCSYRSSTRSGSESDDSRYVGQMQYLLEQKLLAFASNVDYRPAPISADAPSAPARLPSSGLLGALRLGWVVVAESVGLPARWSSFQ
jgi:hypothetical protein